MEKQYASNYAAEDVKALSEKELTEKILAEAKVISEGIDNISESIGTAEKNAAKYEGTLANAALGLRKKTCVHINYLIDDMKKAVKIKP